MLKLFGLLLVVCCGIWTGVFAAMKLRQSKLAIEQICQMLRELAVQMAFRSLPIYALFEQLSQEKVYQQFSFPRAVLEQLDAGDILSDAWEKAIQADVVLPEEAKRILIPLGTQLGASDLEGQLETLDQYRQQMEKTAKEAGKRYMQKQRLYCSLGLLGGLMAAILLS